MIEMCSGWSTATCHSHMVTKTESIWVRGLIVAKGKSLHILKYAHNIMCVCALQCAYAYWRIQLLFSAEFVHCNNYKQQHITTFRTSGIYAVHIQWCVVILQLVPITLVMQLQCIYKSSSRLGNVPIVKYKLQPISQQGKVPSCWTLALCKAILFLHKPTPDFTKQLKNLDSILSMFITNS